MEITKEGAKSVIHDNGICQVEVYINPEYKQWNGDVFFSWDNIFHPYAILQLRATNATGLVDLEIIEKDKAPSRYWIMRLFKSKSRESAADKLKKASEAFIRKADEYKQLYEKNLQESASILQSSIQSN